MPVTTSTGKSVPTDTKEMSTHLTTHTAFSEPTPEPHGHATMTTRPQKRPHGHTMKWRIRELERDQAPR